MKAAPDRYQSMLCREVEGSLEIFLGTETASTKDGWVSLDENRRDDITWDVPGEGPFATRLKAIREAANLTITDLAESAGLSRQTIYNYEGGVGEPTWAVVQKLAEVLGVSTDAFRACT